MTTKTLFSFKPLYFLLWIFIFLVEVLIARYMHDRFIRPFGGDILIVVLIYAFVRSFLNVDYSKIAVGVLLFSFIIEILQAFNYADLLGFEHNNIMRTILGTTFSVSDLICYFIGFLTCLQIKGNNEK